MQQSPKVTLFISAKGSAMGSHSCFVHVTHFTFQKLLFLSFLPQPSKLLLMPVVKSKEKTPRAMRGHGGVSGCPQSAVWLLRSIQ